MGEDVKPQGVRRGGRRASGVNGGVGRDESPVPPIMPIEMGSVRFFTRGEGGRVGGGEGGEGGGGGVNRWVRT